VSAQDADVREVTIAPADVRSGRSRRWWRSFRELAGMPVLVVLAFACLAAISIVADPDRPPPTRRLRSAPWPGSRPF
jgi:hypothetical protein